MKIGNYTPSYLESAMRAEGYTDLQNLDATELAAQENQKVVDLVSNRVFSCVSEPNSVNMWEFIFIPNFGFLSGADPLLTDCQLKLKFVRAKPDVAFINVLDTDKLETLDITDCTVTTEMISSPALRSHVRTDTKPYLYQYEDVAVKIFPLPSNVTNFRVDNCFGGNLPKYLFAGVIETARLDGDLKTSSTKFEVNNIIEFDIMVSGVSVNGYPIKLLNGSSIKPYHKFLDTTGRLCSLESSESINLQDFKKNFLWSHKFEAEGTEGFISIGGKLSTAYTSANMSLVVWSVYPYAVSVDKFNQIEKIQL